MLQVRPQEGDRRWWSADRDLTVIYPESIRQAFYLLERGALTPGELEVWGKLNLSNDELMSLAKAYSKLISSTEARTNTADLISDPNFQNHPAQALLGMIVLRLWTKMFASKYGVTIHRGEEDPNLELLQQTIKALDVFQRPKSCWSSIWKRIRLMWVILRSAP